MAWLVKSVMFLEVTKGPEKGHLFGQHLCLQQQLQSGVLWRRGWMVHPLLSQLKHLLPNLQLNNYKPKHSLSYASKAKIQLPPNRQVRDSSLRNKWAKDGVSRIIAIITLEERPICKSGLIIKVVAIRLHLELLISYFGHSPASLKTVLQADTEKRVFWFCA